MTNQQPREHAPAKDDGSALEVHSIFHTIQGEGPFSGRPAVFIRLAGCNMQCPGCDTDYTSTRRKMSPAEINGHIDKPTGIKLLVVITGGEPFRQNITPLAYLLISRGYTVQIETNGTYAPGDKFPASAVIVCSPKSPKVAPAIRYRANAWKYVIDAGYVDPSDGLPSSILGDPKHAPARPPEMCCAPVFVTPYDEQNATMNATNVAAAVKSCLAFGYILNLQIHKYAQLP